MTSVVGKTLPFRHVVLPKRQLPAVPVRGRAEIGETLDVLVRYL